MSILEMQGLGTMLFGLVLLMIAASFYFTGQIELPRNEFAAFQISEREEPTLFWIVVGFFLFVSAIAFLLGLLVMCFSEYEFVQFILGT